MENIYVYFAQFLRAAKHAHWEQSHIDKVLTDAHSGDYVHALEVVYEAMAEMEEEQQTIKSIV
jgi:hypothetical protein